MGGKLGARLGIGSIGQEALANTYRFNAKSENKIGWEPQKGGQTLFCNTRADVAIYGGAAGSGKSAALLLDCANARNLKVKGYNATIFRRSFPQISNPGGLLDESRLLYEDIGGKLRLNPLDWNFPNNSKISFRHIQYDKSVYDYQGAQICKLCFDELTHFSEEVVFYMFSRNRSGCGIRPTVRATCNPDADSWVAKFIEWWIDQDSGIPIKERRGVIRYFVRLEDETLWANTEEELKELYGENVIPKSATFIYGTIEDNEKLIEKDPNYEANLQALHPVEKARLLYGNWKIRYEAGAIFDKEWFTKIKEIPNNLKRGIAVRFWDMAATAKETSSKAGELKKAFYTANMKMVKIGGDYYITDVRWQRIKGGNIETWIKEVAEEDGSEVRIRWELEGGSAAKIVAESFRGELLAQDGNYDVRAIKPQGDKVTRAIKVASCASRGEIYVVEGEWNTQFLNAVQDFDGSRKPLINDIVDCLSGCFNELEKAVDYDFTDENMTGYTRQYAEDQFYNDRK